MIYIIYGTRAELIKFSPLIRELRKRRVDFKTVDTGQHDNRSLQRSLNLPSPDFHLGSSYRSKWSGLEASLITYPIATLLALVWGLKTFVKLASILSMGDVIVTHGNAMGVPLAIYAAKISSGRRSLVHMESGFRGGTRSSRFLDFLYRFADTRSDYLFTPFQSTKNNLVGDGIRGKVILSGDVMKDVVRDTLKIKTKTKKRKGDYVVANLTRSVTNKHDASQVLHALSDSPMDVLLIMNPKIKKRIERFGLAKMLKSNRIKMTENMNYPDFLQMLKNSRGVVTDSTGVQEECVALSKPCIVTNDFLQIPELETAGVVKKAGCSYIGILGGLRKISNKTWKIKKNDLLGRGSPTKLIAQHLIDLEGSSR